MAKVFVIDVARCSGCHNCQLSCKDEHCENDWTPYAAPQPPTGQFWCHVTDHVQGTIPKVKIHYITKMCGHCREAACMKVCGENAIVRRPDGLVLIDPAKCTGCKACMEACPYDAIFYNEDLHIAQKCTGCAHLLDHGSKLPRCVEACPTDAMKFGEEEDMQELLKDAVTLQPESGCMPRVYYRNIPGQFIGGLLYDPIEEEVLIGAKAELSCPDGSVMNTETDDFGDFWFKNLPVGIYSLTLEAEGFEPVHYEKLDTTECVNLGDIPMKAIPKETLT